MRIFLWVLAIFGAISLLFFTTVIGFGVIGAGKITELSKGAAAYADATIAAYGDAWDEQVLLDRAAPELVSELARNPGAIDQLSLVMDTQAGQFISVEPSACGKPSYSATTASGEIFTAECVAAGAVSRGAATFRVSVVWRSKEWRLLGFFATVAPDGAATTNVVNFVSDQGVEPVGLTAAVGARAIAFSRKQRSITFTSGARRGPAIVGVHAQAAPAILSEEGL